MSSLESTFGVESLAGSADPTDAAGSEHQEAPADEGVGSNTPPSVDPAQTGRFVHALFRHSNEGGFVSLRAFYDDELAKRRGDPPFKIRTVRLNGGGLEPLTAAAVKLAQEAAEAGRAVVVAPPIATFAPAKLMKRTCSKGSPSPSSWMTPRRPPSPRRAR